MFHYKENKQLQRFWDEYWFWIHKAFLCTQSQRFHGVRKVKKHGQWINQFDTPAQGRRKVWKSGGARSNPRPYEVKPFLLLRSKLAPPRSDGPAQGCCVLSNAAIKVDLDLGVFNTSNTNLMHCVTLFLEPLLTLNRYLHISFKFSTNLEAYGGMYF